MNTNHLIALLFSMACTGGLFAADERKNSSSTSSSSLAIPSGTSGTVPGHALHSNDQRIIDAIDNIRAGLSTLNSSLTSDINALSKQIEEIESRIADHEVRLNSINTRLEALEKLSINPIPTQPALSSSSTSPSK